MIELEKVPTKEILKKLNVSASVLSGSFDEHIGSEDYIDKDFVRRYLELFYFCPFKNEKCFEDSHAVDIYKEVMNAVITRFEDNTKGRFASVELFLKCLD